MKTDNKDKIEIASNTSGGVLIDESKNKKYGLLTAISLVVGIIIGGGIFLKNAGVIAQTQSVMWTFIAWIVGGVAITCAALAFMEIISSEKEGKNNGIVGWADKMVGKKFGSLFSWFFLVIYVSAIYTTLAYYAATFTTSAFGMENPAWYVHFLIAGGFLSYFLLVNGLFNKPGQIFQLFLTIFKLIPLIMIILFGIFGKSSFDIFDSITNNGKPMASKGFSGMILALPGVLFAFDGFYYVANAKGDIKDADRNLPKAILIGILFTAIFYALISLAVFSISDPSTRDLANGGGTADAFAKATFSPWFSKFISYTIIIATLVGLNGYTIVGTRLIKTCSKRFKIPGIKLLQIDSKNGAALGASIYALILSLIYLAISALIGITVYAHFLHNKDSSASMITNRSAGFGEVINFISNWQTVIVLIMISILFFFGIVNRFTKKVDVKKQWYFLPTAIISILFFLAVPIYSIIQTSIDGWGKANDGDSRTLIYILIGIVAILLMGLLLKTKKTPEKLITE